MVVMEQERDSAMFLMGDDTSALAVCKLLGSTLKVKMEDVLKEANVANLPHHLQPGMGVLQAMHVDTVQAVKRVAYFLCSLNCVARRFFRHGCQ